MFSSWSFKGKSMHFSLNLSIIHVNVNKAAAILIWKRKFLENRSANITSNHILSSSRITILRP